MSRSLVVGVDFDGTVVTHCYPEIGKDIGAVPVLKRIVNAGHKIVIFTMRSGKELQDVINWYKEREIPVYGVNENPTQKSWTSSPKAYCHIYIDDASLGAPVKMSHISDKVYIDYELAEHMLEDMEII